jgi:hypothetical protein
MRDVVGRSRAGGPPRETGVTVSDPQQPKYGPPPAPSGDGGGQPDPDAGKDLGYLVPHLNVSWDQPYSFNLDPPKPNNTGTKAEVNPLPCGPFDVDLGSLRSAEQKMLAGARVTVADYENLRNKVMSSKDTIFGQNATVVQVTGGQSGVDGNSYGGSGAGTREEKTVNSPIHDAANKFASELNPAMEKVLWQIANTIEVCGQYIAALNIVGQTYAQADRMSHFPEPPPNPVTKS